MGRAISLFMNSIHRARSAAQRMTGQTNMKITINKDICFKTGQCFYLHKELMQEGLDNYPELLVDDIPPELEDAAIEMAQACPSGALGIVK